VDVERRAVRDRLDHLLQRAVGEQRDDGHRERRLRALGAEREQHGERAGRPRADVGDVGGHEVDERDRARVRDVEDQRAEPDHDGVEQRDRRHAREVAAQRLQRTPCDHMRHRGRHAHMALGPRADDRAVLEEEEQAQRGEREEDGERGERGQSAGDADEQRVERVAGPGARVVLGLGGGVGADAGVLEPAAQGVGGLGEVPLELLGLARDAADDQRAERHHAHDDQHQQQRRGGPTGDPAPLQHADQRRHHRGHDPRGDDRHHDRLGQ